MSSRVVSIHRSRLAQIEAEASATAGALQRIALAAQEVLARGGQLQIQPQMAYATGSILRMVKDWGVVESLQADGVAQRREFKK